MTYIVVTSDGEFHEFDNEEDYIETLDKYGPEVVDTYTEV